MYVLMAILTSLVAQSVGLLIGAAANIQASCCQLVELDTNRTENSNYF